MELTAPRRDDQWLVCTLKMSAGVDASSVPGLMDNDTEINISVDHVMAVTTFICSNNPDVPCDCKDDDNRCRCNTSILLQTGQWITVQGKLSDIKELLV